MSLDAVLTTTALRSLAGYAYARGDAYWREGRVVSCDWDAARVEGVVQGEARYSVLLTTEGNQLVADCSCPVVAPACKHAVAVGLCWLARRTSAATVAATAAETASGATVFATRAELEAWCAANDVTYALAIAAETVLHQLPEASGLRYALARLSLREIGALQGAERYVGGRGAAVAVASAAFELVRLEAASVRDGIAEEDARPPGPADPACAALWHRLLAVRADLRRDASPRCRAARATGEWRFEEGAATIAWRERDRIVRGGIDWSAAPVTARLAFPDGISQALECACRARFGHCTHGLALIDATLDVLADPEKAAVGRSLATELLRPGWSRALVELARLDEVSAKPRPPIELWWRFEQEFGHLTLTPVVKKQLKKGSMSAGARMTPARLLEEHRAQMLERDVVIAEQLLAWDPGVRAAGTYPVRAVAALVGHARVLPEAGEEAIAVRRVALGFTALPSGDHIRLEPALDGERLSPRLLTALMDAFAPGEPLVTIEPGGPALVIDVSDDARGLWNVLARHGDLFPPESHTPLLERLGKLEQRLPIHVPRELKGTQVAGDTTVVVRVRLLPDVTLELEAFIRPGPGAPLFPPSSGPRDVMLLREGERTYVRRSLGEELPLVRGLLARLPLEGADEGPPLCFRLPDPDHALTLVAALQEPPPGLEAEWIEIRPSVSPAAQVKQLKVTIDTKRDWFGIAGELKVEAGRLELAVLLDAARRQRKFVRLDEHRWVELSQTLRDKLQAIADRTFTAKDRIELSPGAAPAIEALALAGAKVAAAPSWEDLTARLASSRKLRPKPPATLVATLRDYQIEGHAWLSRIAAWGAGACLADDMGLGKTVQAIAVLLDRAKLGPALVLAPTSVTFNWVDELKRFAPSLRPVVYGEAGDRASCLASLGKRDVLIASYGLLVRDAQALAGRPFATLVIDEAQALKNATTQRAKAARALDAGFRLALSGTPLENHLGELWSLFAVVFPGLLGSWDQFRDRFATPIEKGKDPAAQQALSRVIRPFLLRRTKNEVARELPARTEIEIAVALSKEEMGLYEDARLAAITELQASTKHLRNEQQRFAVLAALTRLRLLASHPKLYDPTSKLASSKLRRLCELLEELHRGDHRALVFSQFTSHLALVRAELEATGYRVLYLDGGTPVKERAKLIARFQAGEGDVFLISLKAGGTGINLTAADYVIHLDPWWNPAVEDQATDRAHRIGQTRPVTVYRLIAHGTIEQQILKMHADKRALVAGILEGTGAAARLSTGDLLALLAAGDGQVEDDAGA